MDGFDPITAIQVCDGAGHLEHAVVCTGRQADGFEGALEKRPGAVAQNAVGMQAVRRDAGIAGDARPAKAFVLMARAASTRFLTDAEDSAGSAESSLSNSTAGTSMKVEAVEQRAAHTGEIAGNSACAANTMLGRVAEISTGTGVHCGHQHNAARIRYRPLRAGNGHTAVLDRLAEDLHGAAGKFRKFVQEQDPIVGEGELPGFGRAPPPERPAADTV